MIVDPNRAKEARARSFLMVPLFKAVFDNYNGSILPPAPALARDMVGLGVAEKTKDRARQVFERSAEQAGFFSNGRDRLVMPGITIGVRLPKEEPGRHEAKERAEGGGKDPLIDALIQKLPKMGEEWPADARVTWLQMIAMAFQMTYGPTEAIDIKKKGD